VHYKYPQSLTDWQSEISLQKMQEISWWRSTLIKWSVNTFFELCTLLYIWMRICRGLLLLIADTCLPLKLLPPAVIVYCFSLKLKILLSEFRLTKEFRVLLLWTVKVMHTLFGVQQCCIFICFSLHDPIIENEQFNCVFVFDCLCSCWEIIVILDYLLMFLKNGC